MRALLAFLATALFATSSFATIVTKNVDYKDGSVKLRGTLAYDSSITTPQPGIILFPEWWGHNDYIKRRAHEMAEHGYIAFAADMYGEDKVTKDSKIAQEWSKPFYEDRPMMRERALAAVTVLKQQIQLDASNIAAIGFCMGGTVALELARTGESFKGVAAFHAGLQFPDPIAPGQVKTKVLVLNGAADPMVPFTDRDKFIEEMQAAGADLQFIQYGGAVHAFTNPDADKFGIAGVAYNEKAEKRSFQSLHTFLNELFAQKEVSWP